MIRNTRIIAIQGVKDTGKDTVGEMLQYLLSTPSYLHNYKCYKNKKFIPFYKSVVEIDKYANNIKRILGVILHINMTDFEDRYFKENYCIDFNTLKVRKLQDVSQEKLLSDSKFNREIKRLDKNITSNYYLTIRQTLQFFGTEVMRHYFGEDIWVLSTISDKCIITDQRFENEYQHVKDNNGLVIHITRPGRESGSHASEAELEKLYSFGKFDKVIMNDGTLEDLFKMTKTIYKELNIKQFYGSNN